MVIAVDFDGTLCEHKFPEIGEIKEQHQKVINFIKERQLNGDVIILWTCREDLERKYLTEAIDWCKNIGIMFQYVNSYPMKNFEGFASRKVCADIYIDDKAVNVKDFL
jgi:molybdenum cofactor biosynthesis enzyme MoaA